MFFRRVADAYASFASWLVPSGFSSGAAMLINLACSAAGESSVGNQRGDLGVWGASVGDRGGDLGVWRAIVGDRGGDLGVWGAIVGDRDGDLGVWRWSLTRIFP